MADPEGIRRLERTVGRVVPGSWVNLLIEPGVLQTVPTDDLVQHELSDECVCGPRVILYQYEDAPDGWQTVHNALDGRL